jgi:FKBP-type peptidyl-prolyl cis-trans isomerase FkpA
VFLRRYTATMMLAAAVAMAAACGGERDTDRAAAGTDPPVASSEVAAEYAPELNVDPTEMTRLGSGLYIRDLEAGEGEPLETGQTALVHYTGWLPDGTLFDSSRQPERMPYDLVVGRGEVIAGWDQGLPGMRVGGRRQLVIPPSLGYGTEGRNVIPPNATLVFEVELIEIR